MKGRKGAAGRSLVTPALLPPRRRLDGGSSVLRLLLLSVVGQVTLTVCCLSRDLSFLFAVVVC